MKLSQQVTPKVTSYGELIESAKKAGLTEMNLDTDRKGLVGAVQIGDMLVRLPKRDLERVQAKDFNSESYQKSLRKCIINSSDEANVFWLEVKATASL